MGVWVGYGTPTHKQGGGRGAGALGGLSSRSYHGAFPVAASWPVLAAQHASPRTKHALQPQASGSGRLCVHDEGTLSAALNPPERRARLTKAQWPSPRTTWQNTSRLPRTIAGPAGRRGCAARRGGAAAGSEGGPGQGGGHPPAPLQPVVRAAASVMHACFHV